MSIVRLAGVVREIGSFVILDHIDAAIAVGDRIGLVGPNGAGKTTLLRIVAGIDEPDAGEVQRRRDLTIGLLAQEAHFDERSWSHRTSGLRSVTAPADLERMETGAGCARVRASRDRSRRTRTLQHRFDVLGGYTLDQRVDEALSGLGFSTSDEIRRHPRRCPAASRRAPRWPGSSSRTPTCCSSTSRRTTSTRRARVARGASPTPARRRCWSRPTTGRSSTQRSERIWELRDRRLTRVPGQLLRLSPPARGARRARSRRTASQSRPGRSRGSASCPDVPQPAQVHEDARARGPPRAPARPSASRRPKRGLRCRRPHAVGQRGAARSGRSRSNRGPRRRLCRATGRASRSLARRGSSPSVASGSASSARTAPARPRCCGRSRATCRRSTARSSFGQGVQLGYLAQLRAGAIPGTTVLDALLAAMPVVPGRGPLVSRAVPVPRRRRGEGGAGAVGRRAVAPRARAARDHAVEPAAPRRAHEPPRHPGARGDRGVHPRDARDRARRQPRPAPARAIWSTGSGSSTTGWPSRSTAAIASGGRRSQAAGPPPGRPRRRRAGCASGRLSRYDGRRRRPARRTDRAPADPPGRRSRLPRRRLPGSLPRRAGLPLAAPQPPRSSPRRPIAARRPLSRRSSRDSASVGATSSSQWATPTWERTSWSCGASRASSPTSSGRSRQRRPHGSSSRNGPREGPRLRVREEPHPRPRTRPVRIGITGPIGCGKSTVARWLAAWGARIVDADALAREVTRPGEPAHDAVLARFGEPVRRRRRDAGPGGPRGDRVRGPRGPRRSRGDRPSRGPAADPRGTRGGRRRGHRGRGHRGDQADRVGLCADRGRGVAHPVRSGRAAPPAAGPRRDEADADRRIAAQHGLAERLEPAATRVIDASGSPEATQDLVAEALRSALTRPDPRGPDQH